MGKFINSPYFNNRSEVVRYYNSFKDCYPLFDSVEFSNHQLFQKVYPGKKYSDVTMRKLNSLTINLILEFITVKSFRERKFDYSILQLENLRSKKLSGMFEKKAKNVEKMLELSKHNISYYEAKVKFTSILNGYLLVTNEESMVSKFQNELDDFVQYFLSVALLQYIRMCEWSRAVNIRFDLKLFDEVIHYLSEQKAGEVTLASIYYNMLMLLNTEEEKYYRELMSARDQFFSKLSELDDYNISIVSIQYCYKKVAKGFTEFRREQFNITKAILEKNLIPGGFMEPYFFTNAVRNSCSLNEFEWCDDFIEEYKKSLKPESAGELTGYSRAMVEFGRGNFEKSLRHLSKINIERANMKLDIKNLLIMIYYELNYDEELISLIDTYKHYLNRDEALTPHSKEQYRLFLKFVSALLKLRLNKNKKSAFILRKEIADANYFNLKDWLVKKAEELM